MRGSQRSEKQRGGVKGKVITISIKTIQTKPFFSCTRAKDYGIRLCSPDRCLGDAVKWRPDVWASWHSYVTQTSLFCIFFSFRGVVDSLQINEWSLMFTTAFLFCNHLTMKYSVHHPDQSTNKSFEYCLILYLKTVVKLANRLLLIKIINCHQFGLLILGSSVSKKLNVQQPHVRGRPPSVILW